MARTALPNWSGVNLHTIGDDAELIDTAGAFAHSYDICNGDLVLIRPDGYIGATAHLSEVHVIRDYLAHFAEATPYHDGQVM